MGARQSKRSVDITTTPKKGESEGAVVGEEKIEKLADADVKAVVTNGTAAHTDIEFADKDDEVKEGEDKQTDPEIKENGLRESSDGEKTPDKEAVAPAAGDQPAKTEEAPTVAEKTPESGEKVAAETPDTKKQKEKKKKKWSLRSISFSKKDKSKPAKEKEKNGEVEELNEEKPEEAVTSPTEESPKTEEPKPVEEVAKSVANGDASKEELTEKVTEAVAEVEKETPKTPEEPAPAPAPAAEAPKEEPKPEPTKVEECVKPVVESPKPATEEIPAVPSTEEVKEVRSEEVPPPLPSSNPPSQVTVFAESTKDNVLDVSEISVSHKPETAETAPAASVDKSPEEVSKPVEPTPVESSNVPSAPQPVSSNESVPSSVEVSQTPSQVETVSPQAPELKEEIKSETKEIIVEPVSKVESSALVVEAISKAPETISSEVEESIKENLDIKCEQVSLQSEDVSSILTTPSVTSEEKMPIVSSAGDVPNTLDTQPSAQSSDASLQELKSNVNVSDSPNALSEKPSAESVTDLSTVSEAESRNEIVNSSSPAENTAPSSPKVESSPVLPQKDLESVVNPAESLPDISTESLPSLPEPTDSLLEPMSLPPLDSVPDPLVDESVPVASSPTAKVESPLTQKPTDASAEQPPVVLTNGNATNGLKSSPVDDETPLPPPLDGPLKQVVAPEPVVGDTCDNSQTTTAAPAEAVESTPTPAQ